MTGDTYSLEYKWVPKATKQETLNDSVEVPKEVKLPSTSTSIKQGNSAPHPSNLQSSEKWVWKPKQIEKKVNPQPQVNPIPIKTIWQQKQVKESKEKPLSLPTSPTSPSKQVDKTIKLQALNLQIKLFALSSVLLSKQSWLKFVRRQQGYRTLADRPPIQVKPSLRNTSKPLR